MVILRCDRCGASYDKPWKGTKLSGEDVHEIKSICRNKHGVEVIVGEYDLCPSCGEEFKRWMKIKDDAETEKEDQNV